VAVENHAKKFRFGIVREFAGHGIGREMHENPHIPNWGKKSDGPLLRAGMTLAIEPMFLLGGEQLRCDDDGWTVRTADRKCAVHWEHTILVTKNSPEVLTRLKK
jgi:methionyl aminopeptidase